MSSTTNYTVQKFPAPVNHNWFRFITAGPKGNNKMWYTAFNAGVGSIDTTDSTPSPQLANVLNVSCAGITTAEDRIWFTQTYYKPEGKGPSITGINTDGSFYARYTLPLDPAVDEIVAGKGKIRWLWAITHADNGRLYFTEKFSGRIGCFEPGSSPTPCGGKGELEADWTVVSTSDPTESELTDIVQGADGNLYFADKTREKIGCLTLSGDVIGEWDAPGNPVSLAAAPDGHVWFTASTGHYLGRLNLNSRTIDHQVILPPGSEPWDITIGPPDDSAVWYTLRGTNQIGRMEFGWTLLYPRDLIDLDPPLHYPGSQSKPPSGIAVGHDDRVWYTAEDHIGVITAVPQ